ncbi:MAG TPA: maleylacetoacetate isomerase [Steroidobacteraceae bacterium]|jgi:maleylacetoacetate isomerase/maleylpyruvate isomerase|nr:maleylacetoacetate isomerase [Steroidobacteraceae bacterium]
MSSLRLYTYYRSSASYRVRIALNLKGLTYEAIPVHLRRDGGEHHSAAYAARNPAELVPVLQDDALTLTQSLAIIEYLEELHPRPALLPGPSAQRAHIRALALAVACDIHPLGNLRVLQYLQSIGLDDARRQQWSQHWVTHGLQIIEQLLQQAGSRGRCCVGDTPTLADCCLVPQLFNAERIGCDLSQVPSLQEIYAHCLTLEPFQRAAPAAQPDAE